MGFGHASTSAGRGHCAEDHVGRRSPIPRARLAALIACPIDLPAMQRDGGDRVVAGRLRGTWPERYSKESAVRIPPARP